MSTETDHASDDDGGDAAVQELVRELTQALGEALVAVYTFGSTFARGPSGPKVHLLVLLRAMDRSALSAVRRLSGRARAAGIMLRLETPDHLVRGCDVLPLFAIELRDTKRWIAGDDVLASLEIRTEHLRMRIEQMLRMLHRDVVRDYLEDTDERTMGKRLRAHVRKAVYALRALGILLALPQPEPPSAAVLVDGVVGELRPEDLEIWTRLRRFAGFEEALEREALERAQADAAQVLGSLIEVVDALQTRAPDQ